MAPRTTTHTRWVTAGLLALTVVPVLAGAMRLGQLAGGAQITPENARFFAAPFPVVVHIVAVTLFGLLGPFQFVPRRRSRRSGWHRRAGWLLAACGLLSALTGLWMALFYPWPEGDGVVLYVERLLVGAGMAASTVMAVVASRRRDFVQHGAWMTRAYALGMGAGTQVLTHVPFLILVGKPGEVARAILMGAGWVINLAIAEWTLRRGPRARGLSEHPTPRPEPRAT